MFVLVISSLIVFAVCAWFLARPFRHTVTADEISAQVRQYALARDRVLRQLEQLEAQTGDGVIEASVASDETLRLEAELVAILKHLEALETTGDPEKLSQQGRMQWLLALAIFALLIPLGSMLMYGSWQADTLLRLASMGGENFSTTQPIAAPSNAFPPEVIAMVERLEQRMAESPDDGAGWKRLGRSYAVMGRYAEAIKVYRKAASLLPDDAEIAEAIQGLQANALPGNPAANASQEFPPQVLAMVAQLENRLAQSPDDGEGWKRLGRAYTVMKRYSEAVSAYSTAAELLPGDPSIRQALQELSQIAANAGSHAESTSSDEQGQAAHPPLPPGSLEEIVRLEQQVAKDPDNAVAWAELGGAYADISRNEEAINALAQAHKLAEDNIDILSLYAEVVFSVDPRDPQGRALTLYKRLNQLSPSHPDGLWFLGLAAYSEGNLNRTIELWTRLLRVLPSGGEGHASVTQALARVELLLNKDK